MYTIVNHAWFKCKHNIIFKALMFTKVKNCRNEGIKQHLLLWCASEWHAFSRYCYIRGIKGTNSTLNFGLPSLAHERKFACFKHWATKVLPRTVMVNTIRLFLAQWSHWSKFLLATESNFKIRFVPQIPLKNITKFKYCSGSVLKFEQIQSQLCINTQLLLWVSGKQLQITINPSA